jgi:hypothetical protein
MDDHPNSAIKKNLKKKKKKKTLAANKQSKARQGNQQSYQLTH